ncbi:MAG: precorrin-2 C(20)-methyltransferase [Thermodesulfobacteriota bacterium]
MRRAKFFGVGVGPGDPELITLKALRLIRECPVIAVPVSSKHGEGGSGEGTIALEIIKKALPDLGDKEILRLPFPMTKDEAILFKSRQEAAREVAARLGEGKDVSFLTLGDPMLYSTFAFLIPLVKDLIHDVELSVVPGVTSVSASAARAVVPLVQAEEKLLVAPAFYSLTDLEQWVDTFDTVVLMKVKSRLAELKDFLSTRDKGRQRGLSATFVERAGWDGKEVIKDLKDLDVSGGAGYLSMIIIRKDNIRAGA